MAEKQRFVSDMTMRQAMAAGARALSTAGIEEAQLDANLLLAHVIGGDRLTLVCDADRSLGAAELDNYSKLIDERKERKPTSRLIGRREFWSLELQISDEVFDPRPDSETLIAAALAQMPNETGNYVIADFGTGSGCLLLAVLVERPGAWGLGLDYSHASVQQAMENARNLRLYDRARFMVGDWGEALSGSFDLILTNPPYITTAQTENLDPEVRCHDPKLALDGGDDGLSAYRAMAPHLHRLLKPGGQAVLECGYWQANHVACILTSAGLRIAETHLDLARIARCLCAEKQ